MGHHYSNICIFVVRVYVKAWITAPIASNAPYNDFQLLKTLLDYSAINKSISEAASQKLSKHLWYISEDLIALAVFDSNVPVLTKRLMVKAMKEVKSQNNPAKRATIKLKSFKEKNLEDFVTERSFVLFKQMELPYGFLEVDPLVWKDREDFNQALKIVKSMAVVNDYAERGIALIQEFSGLLTKDESQFQFLMQVVEEHRRAYPDSLKHTLLSPGPSIAEHN